MFATDPKLKTHFWFGFISLSFIGLWLVDLSLSGLVIFISYDLLACVYENTELRHI